MLVEQCGCFSHDVLRVFPPFDINRLPSYFDASRDRFGLHRALGYLFCDHSVSMLSHMLTAEPITEQPKNLRPDGEGPKNNEPTPTGLAQTSFLRRTNMETRR